MKIKELNGMIDQILEQETKKLILEQIYAKHDTDNIEDGNNAIGKIKSFQTLSGLVDKISNIKTCGEDGKFCVVIDIDNITEEDLINCCGSSSFEDAQKDLMQGLHHDLEDNGMGNNMDVEVNSEGDENALNIKIKITASENDLLGDNNMKKDMNKTETTKTFGEKLYEVKEAGKEKFIHEGNEFNVQECWKLLEEEESDKKYTKKYNYPADKSQHDGDLADFEKEKKEKKKDILLVAKKYVKNVVKNLLQKKVKRFVMNALEK